MNIFGIEFGHQEDFSVKNTKFQIPFDNCVQIMENLEQIDTESVHENYQKKSTWD